MIKFQNVSKFFGRKLVLDKINFEITKGAITTLIGPNGVGKTTIARLILGLEKPSCGQISMSTKLKIGYVPQKLKFNQYLPITVEHFLHVTTGYAYNQIEAYASGSGISQFIQIDQVKNTDIADLSGGQVQRLMLSSALLNSPDILILDEPTKSLDIIGQQEFYRVIEHLRQTLKITIFIISHDLFTVMKTSDKVICLNKHVCCSGRPDDKEFVTSLSEIGFYTHHHDHNH